MKVLITGASGFVGLNLANYLSDKHKVIGAFHTKKSGWLDRNINLVKIDITKPVTLGKLKRVDVVIHTAAILPHHKKTKDEYFKVNTEGTKNMVEWAIKNKVKQFIHISSVGIYDKVETPYTKSKKEAEKYLFTKMSDGFPATIIRPTIAYGPTDERPVFLSLFKLINKGLAVEINDGKNYFHTIYIDNLLKGIELAMHTKKAIGEDFIIGDIPCPKMHQIVDTIRETTGKHALSFSLPLPIAQGIGKTFDLLGFVGIPKILSSGRVSFLSDNRKYDVSKAVKILKYKPGVNLDNGVLKTFEWYKENNYL